MTNQMIRRFFHYLKGPNPLHPNVVDRPVPRVRFRKYADADRDACLDLYRANEPGRFPKDGLKHYETALNAGTVCYLVGEIDGRIVLSCGVNYWGDYSCATLSYGLIAPEFQRRGLGVPMVLVRLALLRTDVYGINVLIFAVKDSMTYYERFGFRRRDNWTSEHGEENPWAVLNIYPMDIIPIRDWLQKHRIDYPHDESLVPLVTLSETESSMEGDAANPS